MIKEVHEIKDKLLEYLETKIKEKESHEEYYCEGFNYSYIKEKIETGKSKNIKAIINKEGDILSFFIEKEIEGFILIDLDNNIKNEILKDCFKEIKKEYEHPLLIHNHKFFNTNMVYDINLNSNYAENSRYELTEELVVLNEEDIDIVKSKIEEIHFPSYLNNLRIEIIKNSEILKDKYDNRDKIITNYWQEGASCSTTRTGFHYFGQDDILEKDDKILALKDGENIVGVIKYGIYKDIYKEGIGDHYTFCFIDVKKPYRGNGIATRLIKELGIQLEKENKENGTNYPLKMTDESQLGKKCRIHDKVKEYIKDIVIIIENHKTYQNEMYLNKKKIDIEKYKEDRDKGIDIFE